VTGLALYASPAQSHPYLGICPPPYDGRWFYWPTGSVTYKYVSMNWSAYSPAIDSAATEFGASAFHYARSSVGPVSWTQANSADTGVAGAAWDDVDCPNARIRAAYLYFYVSHFTASPHTFDQIKCVAIHEFGHGAGLGHTPISSASVMWGPGYHYERCHSGTPQTHLLSHDLLDLAYLYSGGGPPCGEASETDVPKAVRKSAATPSQTC